jgi:ribosome-binding factor A
MSNIRIHDIKRAQKEKLLFREISQLYLQLILDDSRLRAISLSRVELSPDKSLCTVYFYTPNKEIFEEGLEVLKLYKSSIRKAIAANIKGRYTPDLRFEFDERYEKQERLDELLEKVKKEEG